MSERAQLLHDLTYLSEAQLDLFLTAIDPPAGIVPPNSAAKAGRVTALMQWVEGTGGPTVPVIRRQLEGFLRRP